MALNVILRMMCSIPSLRTIWHSKRAIYIRGGGEEFAALLLEYLWLPFSHDLTNSSEQEKDCVADAVGGDKGNGHRIVAAVRMGFTVIRHRGDSVPHIMQSAAVVSEKGRRTQSRTRDLLKRDHSTSTIVTPLREPLS
jgi:hypothetical protein